MDGVHTLFPSDSFYKNHGLFVKVHVSNEWFVVNTCSSCLIWPLHLTTDRPQHSTITLHAINLSQIMTYSQCSLNLNLNLRRLFSWLFLIVDIPYPILGVDFLNYFNLSVDVRRQRLVDVSMSLSTPAHVSTNIVYSLSFITASTGNPFHSLLASFTELVDLSFQTATAVHSTCHHIEISKPPDFSCL